MAREPESVSAQRRELGSRLATFRRAEQLTQAQLAKVLHYERTSISHLEAGRQPAPRTFWKRADEVLNARGALLAAFDDLDRAAHAGSTASRRQAHEQQVDRAETMRNGGIALPVVNGAFDPPARLLDSAIWSWQHPVASDGAVPQAGPAVLHWLVEDAPKSVTRESGWCRVGENDVRRVHAAREHLKQVDNSLGGGAALPMAAAYLRQEIPPLLSGEYNEATGKALVGAIAELALDVGWMAYDAGNQPEARQQMLYALRLSATAGDRLFGGRVACAMSHQALHLGRLSEAVDLARAARTNTNGLAGPASTAMFSAMEACAFAAAADKRRCFDALAAAEKAMDRARPEDQHPAWLDFDAGGMAGHAARAMCALGSPREAQRFAEYAIDNCRPGHSRTRTQREAILARALHQVREFEHAATIGDKIVDEAWCLDSEHVRQEVRRLADALQTSRAAPVVTFIRHAKGLLQARPSSHSLSTT